MKAITKVMGWTLACFLLSWSLSAYAAPTQNILPEDLMAWEQDRLNELYADIGPGLMPDGFMEGTVIFSDAEHSPIERLFAKYDPYGLLEKPLKFLGENLWRGKEFNAASGALWNRIHHRKRFPAVVSCGTSLFDPSKSAIVIDYSRAREVEGYHPGVDWAMTQSGLLIRDEIRMIRPGFYLGRAYTHGQFALNFLLFTAKPEVDKLQPACAS